jgi:tetratricopeptide (TPR) repeat protein
MDAKSIIEPLEKTEFIEDLLTPAPIVEPGAVINYNFEWSNKFNQGKELFFNGNYSMASQRFYELDEILPGHENILTPAKINESFCWLHLGKFKQYVEKWEPQLKLGRVWGNALWNLALAYYKLGETKRAENSLKNWIESPSLRFLAKAYLLLSVLQIRNCNISEAITSFDTAIKANRNFCVSTISKYFMSDIVMSLEGEKPIIEQRAEVIGEDEILSELEKLFVPRGPIKYTKLSQQLSEFEYQTGYITALEKFGDGDIDEALRLIESLLKGAKEKEALIWAKAAFLAVKRDWSGSIKLVEDQLDDQQFPF